MFGYLLPNDGTLLGFCIDFIENGNSAKFYVFVWEPSTNNVKFTSSIDSNSPELFGSGTTLLNESVTFNKGNYLFAVQDVGQTSPAIGLCHITAYTIFQ